MTACFAETINGIPTCVTHNRPLVKRQELESQGIKIEQPAVGSFVCPVSHQPFSEPGLLDEDLDELLEG